MRSVVIVLSSVAAAILLIATILIHGALRSEAPLSAEAHVAAVSKPVETREGAANADGDSAVRPAPQQAVRDPAQPVGMTILLLPEAARIHGFQLHLQKTPQPQIVYWVDPQEYIEWHEGCPRGGDYEVELSYACAPGAGGAFVLRGGGGTLSGRSEPTGGWNVYRSISLGRLHFERDRTTVLLKAAGTPQYALMNVKQIRLIPAAQPAKH